MISPLKVYDRGHVLFCFKSPARINLQVNKQENKNKPNPNRYQLARRGFTQEGIREVVTTYYFVCYSLPTYLKIYNNLQRAGGSYALTNYKDY